MKRSRSLAVLMALIVSSLMLTACGKSEFSLTENTGKRMVITAERADKDAFFAVGSLEVAEGEEIVITSELTKGSIRVELFAAPEEQSMDEVMKIEGEAVLTADLAPSEGASGTVPAGTYLLKATCLKRATGTARVEVKPAS